VRSDDVNMNTFF